MLLTPRAADATGLWASALHYTNGPAQWGLVQIVDDGTSLTLVGEVPTTSAVTSIIPTQAAVVAATGDAILFVGPACATEP